MLQAGRYQRWRPIHTGYKRFFDLMIIDPNTNMPTDQCELLLLSKDGVYLLEMPRAVDHIFLTSANRQGRWHTGCSVPHCLSSRQQPARMDS